MLKNKLFVAFLFLGLLGIGLLAVSGQSQPQAPRRASGLGLRGHAALFSQPAHRHPQKQRVQQPAAVSLSYGLIDFPRSTASTTYGINKKGDIVGGYGPIPPPLYFETTGYSLKGNTYRTLAYPGAAYSAPYGINDKRVIVGFYDFFGDQNFRGYQYKGSEFTNIDYPGAPVTGPLAINNSDEIIGIYFDSTDTQHGFTLKNGLYTSIDVPNSYDTEPRGINSKGVIVGDYYDFNNIQHGFIYQSGQFTTVDYPGTTNTVLSGINDAGQIVGTYGDDTFVAGIEWGTTNIFLLDQGTFTPLALPLGDIQVTWSYTMNGNQFVGFYVDSLGNLFGYEAQIANGAVSQISGSQQ
ncbi:MAG: hypothetical protein WCC22_04255 [Terriglobales bacterium]